LNVLIYFISFYCAAGDNTLIHIDSHFTPLNRPVVLSLITLAAAWRKTLG
jgi:hypothetical protein